MPKIEGTNSKILKEISEGNKKNRKPIEIDGFDWVELSEYFGLDIENEKYNGIEGDKLLVKHTQEKISELWKSISYKECVPEPEELTEQEKEDIKVIRLFVKKLYKGLKHRHFDYPVYKGLLKIKHNETFLKYVEKLLDFMWC